MRRRADPDVRHLSNSAGALLLPEAQLRPGPDRHRRVRDRPGHRHRRPGRRPAAAGDAAARPAGERQGSSTRARASRTGTPGTPPAATRWGWCRSATATASRGTPATRPRSAGAAAAPPIRGRICMDQFVVELGDHRRRAPRWARRSRCSAPVITASRPPRTGPPGAAPSATRSSPGSAPGCRGSIRTGETAATGDRSRARDRGGVADGGPVGSQGRSGPGRVRASAGVSAGGWHRPGYSSWSAAVVREAAPHRRSRRPTEDFFALRSTGRWSSRRTVSCCTPRSTTPTRRVPTAEDELTLVLVHGYALSLDCWHFQRKHFRGRIRHGAVRPALARPVGPLGAGAVPDRRSWPRTCCRCSTRSSATARWCWPVTRWAG